MSEQKVPWAVGRRALVLDIDGAWLEGVGQRHPQTGVAGWTVRDGWISNEPLFIKAALLPNQCPRCYEVGTHAPDCEDGVKEAAREERIADNLARGVPAFWAEWVMWSWPSVKVMHGVGATWLGVLGSQVFGVPEGAVRDAPQPPFGVVALGPGGFTLAPWGL